MEITLKVIGSMINEKVREVIILVKRINFLLVSGLMTNQNVVSILKWKTKMLLHEIRSLTF
jgi:hypothetical protein